MLRLPIYLDYMATTPVDPRVAQKMMECLDINGNFANPASRSHVYGWRAEEAVEKARTQVAAFIHAEPREIVWTSGATEAINLAIKGAAYFYQRKGKHIVTVKTEHKAVLDTCAQLANEGYEISYLPVQQNGSLDLNQLEDALRADTVLVSVMHVNNEIGVVQDVSAIAEITRQRGVLFHVDAAQSMGKVPIDLQKMKIDLMSFSAHKVYGPKGVGALFVRRQPRVRLQPLIHGGGHEFGLRSGTLPTHQIVGMGEAFQIAQQEMHEENLRILELRNKLWQKIQMLENVVVNGDLDKRVAHNLNVAFADVEGESLLVGLKDLAVSTGSACNSATIEPSYVLSALGLSYDLAHSSIRFSLGRFTTVEEIDYAALHIIEIVNRLRAMSPF